MPSQWRRIGMTFDILSLVKERHNVEAYKALNWTGSYREYLETVGTGSN